MYNCVQLRIYPTHKYIKCIDLYVRPTESKTMEKRNEIKFDSDEIQIYKPITVVSFPLTQPLVL